MNIELKPFGPVATADDYPMRVQLREDLSTPLPDDPPIIAARGDHMSEGLIEKTLSEAMEGTDKSREEFLGELIRRGHFGPFEHSSAFFAVENISRVVMAQVTRHRHMSFDVQSMRYVDFDDKDPVVPPQFDDTTLEIDGIAMPMRAYRKSDLDNEIARYGLPLATPVNMTFTANIRSLFHLFDLRISGKAQEETMVFAKLVRALAKEWAPLSFEAYEEHTNNNSLRAP